MNILTIGYYDDFSRFFLKIKKVFNTNYPNSIFRNLSIYPSGYLYWRFRNKETSLLSAKARFKVLFNIINYKKIVKNSGVYRGVKLKDIINYHTALGENSYPLMLQACGYIDIIYEELEKAKIDIVICSSDSRMVSEVTREVAKLKKVKVFYFEQGPFNTTAIDEQGVNANAAIRGAVISKKPDNKTILNDFFNRQKEAKYKRNPLYRASDYLIEAIVGTTFLYPPELKNTTHNTFLSKFKKPKQADVKESKCSLCKKFLLILQVPFDVNMIYHSPYFNNHFEIVKAVSDSLPDGSKLIVREHPLYKNGYENELYELCGERGILIDSDNDLKLALSSADVVVVNNSTVGLESIALNKPTVVLGDALYDSSNVCLKLTGLNRLEEVLSCALSYKVNDYYVTGFLFELYFNYYIHGHFRDGNIDKLAELVFERITGHLND